MSIDALKKFTSEIEDAFLSMRNSNRNGTVVVTAKTQIGIPVFCFFGDEKEETKLNGTLHSRDRYVIPVADTVEFINEVFIQPTVAVKLEEQYGIRVKCYNESSVTPAHYLGLKLLLALDKGSSVLSRGTKNKDHIFNLMVKAAAPFRKVPMY